MQSAQRVSRKAEKLLQRKAIGLIIAIFLVVLSSVALRVIEYHEQQKQIDIHTETNTLLTNLISTIGLNAEYRGLGLRFISDHDQDTELLEAFLSKQREFKESMSELMSNLSSNEMSSVIDAADRKVFLDLVGRLGELESLVLKNSASPEEWFYLNNQLIDIEIEIANIASAPNSDWQWLGFLSELKQDAAVFINYAGQERAVLSTALSNNTPIHEGFNALQDKYYVYVEQLRSAIDTDGLSPELKNAITLFVDLYDNRFAKIKSDILSPSETMAVTVTPEQWWKESSIVIDAAQQVSYEAGRSISDNYLSALKSKKKFDIYKSLVELIAIMALLVTLVWWLLALIMRYIKDLRNQQIENYKYVRAIENSPVGIILFDTSGDIEYANRVYREKVAPSTGSTSSISIEGLVTEKERRVKLIDSIRNGTDWRAEVKSINSLGESYVARVVSKPLVDEESESHIGTLIIHDDISEQKSLEKQLLRYQNRLEMEVEDRTFELKASEARTAAIFEMAVSSIITINTAGAIIQLNKAAEEMFGFDSEEIIGQNISLLMPDKYAAGHDEYIINYLKTGTKKIIGKEREVEAQRKNGELFPISLSISEVKTDREHFFVGMITDISERKAFEKSLKVSKDMAERVSQIKSTFLANMSHELRTPMNGVIGMTEVVLETDLSEKQRKHLNTVLSSAKALLGILNEVLDLAKLEDGRMTLSHIDFSMNNLLSEALDALGFTARRKGLDFSLNVSEKMPDVFNGDPLRIRQVLVNLVGNAIKFTEHGYVIVSVDVSSDNNIKFTVTDSGIGIPKDRIDSIFDSFTQADAGVTRRFGGTGLGTTISKQLVELMGGRIEVESVLNEGTTFFFEIPLQAGSVEIFEKIEQSLDDVSNEYSKLNVLVAEDQTTNQELIRLRLEKQGHNVTIVEDGNLAFLAMQDTHYDIVLMDGHMPNLDGYEATRCIRRYERENKKGRTPIIALTASVMLQDRQRCIECDMDGFVAKPIDFFELFSTINHVLSQRRAFPAASSEVDAASVIDFKRGLERWDDCEELYNQALFKFADGLRGDIEDINRALDTQDLNRARILIHTLKGNAGSLQAEKLVEIASSIEARFDIDNEHLTESLPLIEAMASAADELLSVIDGKRSPIGEEVERTETDIKDPQVVLEALKRVKSEVVQGQANPESLKILNNQLSAVQLKPLVNALDSFDFDAADSAIDDLIKDIEQGTKLSKDYAI